MKSKEIKNKIDLLVVGGPTATGKTDLAIDLAKEINGFIINADSVQVYRYMDIGSNKGNINYIQDVNISPDTTLPLFDIENSGVYGLLFDVVEPDYNFNVSEYQRLTLQAIDYAKNQNMIPILVGGTGLYIDSVIRGYHFANESSNNELRKELEELNLNQLTTRLLEISPNVYENLNESDKYNPRRLIRLIEKNINNNLDEVNNSILKHLFLYPEYDKDILFTKIENRVDWMFENGFVEEVKKLIERGYDLTMKSMQSTGYKQITEMLLYKIYGMEECKFAIKTAHKKYAKRQITWFEGKNRAYKLIKVRKDNAIDILKDFL